MTLTMALTWIVVGLLTGWLATRIAREGGHGLVWDLLLGVAGSSVASVICWNLGASADAGALAMAIVAFVGATTMIIAQRSVWSASAIVRRFPRTVPKPRR